MSWSNRILDVKFGPRVEKVRADIANDQGNHNIIIPT